MYERCLAPEIQNYLPILCHAYTNFSTSFPYCSNPSRFSRLKTSNRGPGLTSLTFALIPISPSKSSRLPSSSNGKLPFLQKSTCSVEYIHEKGVNPTFFIQVIKH